MKETVFLIFVHIFSSPTSPPPKKNPTPEFFFLKESVGSVDSYTATQAMAYFGFRTAFFLATQKAFSVNHVDARYLSRK